MAPNTKIDGNSSCVSPLQHLERGAVETRLGTQNLPGSSVMLTRISEDGGQKERQDTGQDMILQEEVTPEKMNNQSTESAFVLLDQAQFGTEKREALNQMSFEQNQNSVEDEQSRGNQEVLINQYDGSVTMGPNVNSVVAFTDQNVPAQATKKTKTTIDSEVTMTISAPLERRLMTQEHITATNEDLQAVRTTESIKKEN